MCCFRYQMLYELANGIILSSSYINPNNGANLLALKTNRSSLMDSKTSENNMRMAGNKDINIKPDNEKTSVSFISNSCVSSANQNLLLTLPTQQEGSSENMAEASVSTEAEKNVKSTLLKLVPPSMPTSTSSEAAAANYSSPKCTKQPNISFPKCETSFKCDICNKTYANRSNLLKHNRIKHSEQNLVSGKILCKEKKCNISCRILHQLRTHLQSKHQIEMKSERYCFNVCFRV